MSEAVREEEQRGGAGVDVAEGAAASWPGSNGNHNDGAWEIEEVEEPAQPAGPPPPAQGAPSDVEDVYVAVGKGGSSMAALSWALRHLAKPRSFVYLVHVFPAVTSIPTPLGMMPKSQASPEQIETYMNRERFKRREMLQKYLDHCRNFKVNFDVHLIESDQIVDAIIELVPVLTIKQLVLGVSKSNLRKLRKGNTIAGQIQKDAPLYCEVKIVCDGKEVTMLTSANLTPPFSPSPLNNSSTSRTPTPPSSTPNRDNIEANGDKGGSKHKQRKKITIFLRCLSF